MSCFWKMKDECRGKKEDHTVRKCSEALLGGGLLETTTTTRKLPSQNHDFPDWTFPRVSQTGGAAPTSRLHGRRSRREAPLTSSSPPCTCPPGGQARGRRGVRSSVRSWGPDTHANTTNSGEDKDWNWWGNRILAQAWLWTIFRQENINTEYWENTS